MSGAPDTSPVLGLSGREIPFTRLVRMEREEENATVRLRESDWLKGAAAAGLPSAYTVLGDVVVGMAGMLGRSEHDRLVTETLRVDVLRPCDNELELTGRPVWSGPRRAITTGVIHELATGEPVAHVLGRVAIIDGRKPGSLVSRQADESAGDHTPATVAELLADGGVQVSSEGEVLTLWVPVTAGLGNSYGFMHGGAAAVLCDVGLDWLRRFPPANLAAATVTAVTVNYLAPLSLDDAVTVTARVVVRGPGRAEVVVAVGDGGPEAGATASYILRVAR